jgi:hypothetical protein
MSLPLLYPPLLRALSILRSEEKGDVISPAVIMHVRQANVLM